MLRTAQGRIAPFERHGDSVRGPAGTDHGASPAVAALRCGLASGSPRSGGEGSRDMNRRAAPAELDRPANLHGPIAGSGPPGFGDGDNQSGTAIVTKTKPRTKRPNLYRVLLLNDDYTPMEFVVHVLERFFNKNREDATRIMLHVHQNGVGECGVFTYEVAETKVTQVMDFARKHQHPLQCVMEKK
jgi:ATP-dependent Clp protease adaptor protein ClpS